MVSKVLAATSGLVAAGDRGVMATAIDGPEPGMIVLLDSSGRLVAGGSEPPAAVVAVAQTVLDNGTPEVIEADGVSWFVEPVLPPPKLIVLGAIAAADALVPMATAAGFAVHVIDTREWLADDARFPEGTAVHCGAPLDMLRNVGIDSATSIVSFLHEGRLEDPVLLEALRSPARYVGSMGSGKSTAAKRERLADAGIEPRLLARLHAPIGLRIGSRTPQEMAVAVLAEVVAVGRGHG